MCFDIRVVTCGPNEALVISGKICFHEKKKKKIEKKIKNFLFWL